MKRDEVSVAQWVSIADMAARIHGWNCRTGNTFVSIATLTRHRAPAAIRLRASDATYTSTSTTPGLPGSPGQIAAGVRSQRLYPAMQPTC